MTALHSHVPYQQPVVVGITGHRIITADVEACVRKSINLIFDELDQFSHGPVQVMSSLAEGADRIFAKIALHRGYRCIAPLPMPPDDYENDFTDEESRTDFRYLLDQCEWYVASPLTQSTSPISTQNSAYLAAGYAVTAESHVLVALWDGKKGLPGGTSDIVACTLDPSGWVEYTDADRLTNANGCIVYHIETPRPDTEDANVGKIRRLIPAGWTTDICDRQANSCGVQVESDTIRKLLRPIAVFNLDSAKYSSINLKELTVAFNTKFCVNSSDLETKSTFELYMQSVCAFMTFDSLAARFQHMSRCHVQFRLGLLVVGMGVFEAFTGPFNPEWNWILGGLILVGGAMIGWPLIKRDMDQRFVDYRVICECTRVFLFLQVAGISDIHPAQHIRYQGRGLDWIKLTLCTLHRQFINTQVSPNLEKLEHIQLKWIQSQISYFKSAASRESGLQRRNMKVSGAMLACAIALVIASMLQMHLDSSIAKGVVSIALLGAVILLLLIGVLQTYSGYRAYREHVNRFATMESIYATANRDLTIAIQQNDLARAVRITRHIAILSLQETSDWLILHRERPPEISPV